MRIISKFRDYYDSLQAHGADNDLLLLRETVEHKAPDRYNRLPPTPFQPLFDHFDPCFAHRSYHHDHFYQGFQKWSALKVQIGIVLFIGKPYLFFRTERTLKDAPLGTSAEVRYIYDIDEMDTLVQEHGSPSIYEYKVNRWSRRRSKSWALSTWELACSKEFSAFASMMQAPIIYISGRGQATTYPRLADFQFYKVIQPWQAYQELSMFLGNIAAPDRVPVTIADKDRVQQHGFDMKYGFRTRPKD